ncbi:MAG: ATP-dependent helicase HrpB [Pseudohongiellaceae bacterium]
MTNANRSNPELPIDAVLSRLRESLARHNRCLLVARPGTGKTTRAPLALLEDTPADAGRWLMLEPRRVAARLAAVWMAEQLGEKPGETVGYRVRGDSKVSTHTRLEIVTQGILTRMLQNDPMLEGVTGVIFDEFHERSLEADLGLALTLDVQTGLREDLKLLIMSATLDVQALLTVLGEETPVIDCPGRSFEVTTHYRSAPLHKDPALHQASVVRDALDSHDGHILMFLPGQREIRRLQQALESTLAATIDILPLHGQLPLARQQSVLRPPANSRRRVILSTAIAESSLTVPGVRIVIDAGRERVPVFQPRSGLTRLDTRPVNRASADQRRGRAGREAEGFCYRLWAEEQLLVAHREPEIRQADLSGLVFELARWGTPDPEALPWVTPPPPAAVASGRDLLRRLGLLQNDGGLSESGRQAARWPTHPRLAVLLEHALRQDCLPLACWLVAWLEESIGGDDPDIQQLLAQRPANPRTATGNGARWQRMAQQWARRASTTLRLDNLSAADELLATAYPDRIAQRQGEEGRFKLVTGGQVQLPASHTLAQADYLVAVELDGQASGARLFHGIALSAEKLPRLFPDCKQWQEQIGWDERAGRVTGEQVRRLGELILERRPLKQLPPDAVQKGLLQALRQRGELHWSEADRQLLGRLRLLRRVLGDPWPEVGDTALMDSLEQWLAPWLDGVKSLAALDRLPLGRFLHDSLLDWSLQQTLIREAPTHQSVPSGSRIRIDYTGEEPVLAVKLQALFGMTETPRIAGGRMPVLIHLLSPAGRPVQVTRDLAGFWSRTYFDVRRDLKGRYPKHPWPDDPLTAVATHRTRRRSG